MLSSLPQAKVYIGELKDGLDRKDDELDAKEEELDNANKETARRVRQLERMTASKEAADGECRKLSSALDDEKAARKRDQVRAPASARCMGRMRDVTGTTPHAGHHASCLTPRLMPDTTPLCRSLSGD